MTTDNDEPPASAAAATASGSANDATIAQALQTAMMLTDVFGFPGSIADQAIEAVGVDVTTCYNYILDNGLAQDQGGPVVPIENCPHVEHHVLVTPEQLPPMPHTVPCSHHDVAKQGTGAAKGDVKEDGSCPSTENWICLHCGVIRCSRYINGHGVAHYEASLAADEDTSDPVGHCVAASLSDLSVWCHACKAYLKGPQVETVMKKLEELKFGKEETKG
jgi:histone deacetylase 6